MSNIHLIEGPVGAGKSTYAGKLSLALKAPHLDLDEWMVNLFSPDRPTEGFMPWYLDCKARCMAQIWLVAGEILNTQGTVILELGLVSRADRDDFYRRVDATDRSLEIHCLDVPEETRRARVMKRNDQQDGTFKMAVSPEIFALANSAWEAPDENECLERNLQFV